MWCEPGCHVITARVQPLNHAPIYNACYRKSTTELPPCSSLAQLRAGYFDLFGNYVEYRLDTDARDAWLDSLGIVSHLSKDRNFVP